MILDKTGQPSMRVLVGITERLVRVLGCPVLSGILLGGLTRRFQKRLAKVNATPWLMATGEDFRWSTTFGGQPEGITRLMHRYIDQVLLLSVGHPEVYRAFGEVVHMVKPPGALFQPGILTQVLKQAIEGIF